MGTVRGGRRKAKSLSVKGAIKIDRNSENAPPEIWIRDQESWPAQEEEGEQVIHVEVSEFDQAIPWSDVKKRHGI